MEMGELSLNRKRKCEFKSFRNSSLIEKKNQTV